VTSDSCISVLGGHLMIRQKQTDSQFARVDNAPPIPGTMKSALLHEICRVLLFEITLVFDSTSEQTEPLRDILRTDFINLPKPS